MLNKLKSKIINKDAHIGIIGLGYVGLPLAVEFAKVGFNVTGFDTDGKKVSEINKGSSYILDVPAAEVKQLVSSKKLSATKDKRLLNKMDAIIICVPTPLRKTKEPDISFILAATEDIAANIRKGQLIILESTTYPGTTEEVILTRLGADSLKVGEDFCLAFSPERVDPGNPKYKTKDIPKVVGGVGEKCTEMARLFYSQIIKDVITVSSTRAAEMVKLLENTFRIVNIALINELALLCNKMGVNIWEIIEAAKTKPFGFMPFYPGPGVGGHCIGIDPHYLSWKARLYGFETRFIELAEELNSSMPHHVVDKIIEALNTKKKALKGSRILILGVTYKKDITDVRESPAVTIINSLLQKEARVEYYDPLVPAFDIEGRRFSSVNLTEEILNSFDCVAVVTDHSGIDYKFIVDNSKLIVDTRNALKNFRGAANIITL
jgi:UDP-N-acetyl-D-glucosamine dehydrogenase